MRTFKDFYETTEYNNFKEMLRKDFKAELIATQFESFLIMRDDNYIHEVEFDIDFDNKDAYECTNIINTCMMIIAAKAELIDNDDKFYTDDLHVARVTGKSVRFKKLVTSKLDNVTVKYTKRHKYYETYETMVHDELIRQYMEYPA